MPLGCSFPATRTCGISSLPWRERRPAPARACGQLAEAGDAGAGGGGEEADVAGDGGHVEAPADGARGVVGGAAVQRRADAGRLAGGDDALQRLDHLGLLAVEGRA